MADGRHVEKYWKYHNSPTNWPIGMKLGWSHPIMFPTCPPWCGCHGNGRWVAKTHWTFCCYGRLEAERVNQFWWNLVCNSKLGPQWQSWDQILKFLKFKMADCRHVGKYSNCHISPKNGPTGTQLRWSHPIMPPTCPPWCGCHGNWRCLATAHCTFSSYGCLEAERRRTCEPILLKFGIQQQIRTTVTVMWSNIKSYISKWRTVVVGKYLKCHNSPANGPTGTQLGWSHPIMFPIW